ncbi:alpha/beta hydrolase [Roseomonas sp. PWR1]|uniref:Alpha/beta hydrolase n=1 Tax=Roseomonas nitratireducens TaxID=2820810 RepID=A0ABS4ARN7_9PROT|nr:alpha/beta hydrolase [Neoroseomonas nitratireducens]MBP0464018.1 alpha/beta hydrolase [Neoroseomonas nitratireducens]
MADAAQTAGHGASTYLLDLPGGPLEVEVAGDGHPIVLIPSLGRGQEDYDAIAPTLVAAGLRLIRPEPRGIGRSAPLTPGATLHDMAADVAVAMERFAGGPALVAGHAAGNWVARMLGHDRPDLVRGIAMLAAVTGTEVTPEISRAITSSFDSALPDAERLRHLQRAYFAPGHDASVWLAGWHPEVARAQRAARTATQDRAWLRAAEAKPLLYLAAEEDAIAPPPSEAEVQALLGPLARCAVVARAGHALLPEQPAAVAAALIAFARDLWG